MAISSPAELGRDAGFTLFEMMVALVIGALFTASLAGLSRTISPRVELRATIERVAADFERARLEARRTGRPVAVNLGDSGYEIDALALHGDWDGADFTLVEGQFYAGVLTLSPEPFASPPAVFELSRDGLAARVEIRPASGRVEARIVEP